MVKRRWITLLILGIVLVVAAGVGLGMTHLVLVEGHFYPSRSQALDLTEEELSEEAFQALSRKLPDCYILWNIPFQGGFLASDTTTVSVSSLTDEDVALLDYATLLETVDGENCTDYAQLAELQRRHPDADVRFRMTIRGVACDQDTTKVALKGLTQEDVQLLSCLSRLESVEITGCTDYALLQSLQQTYPQWNLSYTVTLGNEEFPWGSKRIEAENATFEQLEAAVTALPQLKTLSVTNPVATGEQMLALQEAYTDAELSWQVALYDQIFASDVTEVDLSGIEVESCEAVEAAVASLPNLEKLVMSGCGIDSETMAQFRERQRENYKVVWTVYLGKKCKVRTDDITFMPIQQGEYYFLDAYSEELKYCEDMVCLDLGHHAIHNIEFVAYMPHLKYLILAHTQVQDISPISNCKELIYLELDWGIVTDFTPLLGCTALEDLNLGKLWASEEPITQMTWLKNLWWMDCGGRKQVALIEALPDTHLVFNSTYTVGSGWRKLQNYYDMRDLLGAEYME